MWVLGCSSGGRAWDWHATETGSAPWCGKGFFSQESTFRLSYGVRTPPCAIAYIYTSAHVKDPIVHVRVRLIMEIQKHLVCIVGWVVWLCRSWLSPGKATQVSHWSNPIWTIRLHEKWGSHCHPADLEVVCRGGIWLLDSQKGEHFLYFLFTGVLHGGSSDVNAELHPYSCAVSTLTEGGGDGLIVHYWLMTRCGHWS